MKKLTSILASMALTLMVGSSIVFAAGDDFWVENYGSSLINGSSYVGYSGYTEGGGSDLSRVRVYSYFYANGSLLDTDYDNDVSYASVDYTVDSENVFSAEIKSSHYAYNIANDKDTRTSTDYWD
ncbi:hypothetical protein [Brevibacillus sp. SYSU BS000544]|uniref:hypothetical protein n=1 Tax=Brevibacillus sp. SYSU BS000544 TaxID=3416443 RepID=UPI003CE54F2D